MKPEGHSISLELVLGMLGIFGRVSASNFVVRITDFCTEL
ncbi:hypothetical protein RintRC_2409 [Richelia intracellularis]|nr:hypothetical protein RintRC_2409 [Richelia intracellularis]